jgi:hypothetical protein
VRQSPPSWGRFIAGLAVAGEAILSSSIVAAAQELPRCHTPQLSVAYVDADGAAGHITDRFRLTNTSDAACNVYGFVGAQMLNGAGEPLPTRIVRNGGFFSNQAGPSDVPLPPGASGYFWMLWSDVPTGNETSCPAAARLEITPPDETTFLVIDLGPYTLAPCNSGTIDVTPVRAASELATP